MKIIIDISQIVHGVGVSVYTANLVRGLARVDKKNEYLLLGTSLRKRSLLEKFTTEVAQINPNFKNRIFPWPITVAEIWANRWRFGFLENLVGLVDVYHSSDWLQIPSQAAKVTTIHDLAYYHYPWATHEKILKVMRRKLRLVEKEVDRIIAVSQTTVKDAHGFLQIPLEKIDLIYEAAGEEFKQVSKSVTTKVKKKYKIKSPYLLAVATLEPRKNFTQIFQAFVEFLKNNPGFSLVVVGKMGWDLMAQMVGRRIPQVVFTGFVPTSDLVALYNGAWAFLFPSLYEGFGLPVLEAMACGCPVITSNVSSLPEIGGKSALLVDPLRTEPLVKALEEMKLRREELIKRGLKRARKFSWDQTAIQTIKVYEKAFRFRKNL
ncbi:glycosyltransferase family 4 protein [Patescibacteria group bacterium]